MTTFKIHASNGSRLNGVHFELTGDAVTETVGGSMELTEEDLARNYTSFCDPRYGLYWPWSNLASSQ